MLHTTANATTTTYTHSGLSYEQTVYYRVTAHSQIGSSRPSVVVSATTSALESTTITLTATEPSLGEGSPPTRVSITASYPTTSEVRTQPTVVELTVAGNGAVPGEDFTPIPAQPLTIPANARSASTNITVSLVDDNIFESSESITINGTAGNDTVTPTTISIVDNDNHPGRILLDVTPNIIRENAGSQSLRISASFPPNSSVLPTPTLVTGTISAPDSSASRHYSASSPFRIRIDSLSTSGAGSISFTVNDDSIANADVDVSFSGSASGFTVVPTSVQIQNDDTATVNGLLARVEETRIQLTWGSPTTSAATSITSYVIEFSVDDGFSWASLHTTANGATTSYTHDQLSYGQTVHYRITAHSQLGPGNPSAAVSATTSIIPPASVSALVATGSRNRTVLEWTPPTFNGGASITGYRIEAQPRGQNWQTVEVVLGASTSSYIHRGLPPSQVINYRVYAINLAGESTSSSTVQTMTDREYTANLVADMNQDSTVSAEDAIVLYYAHAMDRQLGDGANGGSPRFRRSILSSYLDNIAAPNDDDYQQMLLAANTQHEAAGALTLDLNGSGEVNENDALILYYSIVFADLLGDGTRGGFPRYRYRLLKSHIHPWTNSPADSDLQQLIRNARKLGTATTNVTN